MAYKSKEAQAAAVRRYRENNRDKLREMNRAWRAKNVEHMREYDTRYLEIRRAKRHASQKRYEDSNKELVAARKRDWFAKNPDYLREYYIKNARKNMLNACRMRAAKRGFPCSITIEDIVIPDICPVLGIPIFHQVRGHMRENSPSVDKIVPEFGYVPGNVRVISNLANTLKRTEVSPERLRAVADYIEQEVARVRRELGP